MAYPYELSRGEGILLYESIQISHGKQIYNNINARPYMVANYPPLYQLICSAGILLSGKQTLFFGRLISVLSTSGIAILLFLIIFRLTKSKFAGIFSVLIFCSFWYVYEWTPLHRVDILGILLGLAGLYWTQVYAESNKLYWAVLFFTLSFFTKQSLIFAPISAAIFLLLKDKKKALYFSLSLGLTIAVIFFAINLKSNGQFLSHLHISFLSGFRKETTFNWLKDFIVTYPIYILLAGYSIFKYFREKEGNLYIIYFVFSIITAIGVGKVGAYANYYLELCITTSILIGLTWDYLIKHNNLKIRIMILFLLCYQMNSLTSINFSSGNLIIGRKPEWTHTPDKRDFDEGKKLVEEVRKLSGIGFSEGDTIYLSLAGKEMEYHSFLPVYEPRWKSDSFLRDLNSGRYQFFISESYYEPLLKTRQAMKMDDIVNSKPNIIAHNYKIKEQIGQYYIYVLKDVS